jgi:hypothetical protein
VARCRPTSPQQIVQHVAGMIAALIQLVCGMAGGTVPTREHDGLKLKAPQACCKQRLQLTSTSLILTPSALTMACRLMPATASCMHGQLHGPHAEHMVGLATVPRMIRCGWKEAEGFGSPGRPLPLQLLHPS